MEEMILRRENRLWPHPSPIKIPGFTATELAAAEQLVHLSESSTDSSLSTLQRSLSCALSSSSSSSPISVESAATPLHRRLLLLPSGIAEEEEEEDGGLRRRRPRYRRIAEVYAEGCRIDAGDRGRGRKREDC